MTDAPSTPDAAAVELARLLGDALGQAIQPADVDRELRASLAHTRRIFGAAACSFAEVLGDGTGLRFRAADGVGAEAIVGVEMPLNKGIVGWAAVSGEPVRIGEVQRDARFARDVAEATDYVPQTILAVPVVDLDGETLGVIEVLDPTEDFGSSGRELGVLEALAAQVAVIVRLGNSFQRLGSAVLRAVLDPDHTGAVDPLLARLGASPEDAGITALAEAFRGLAGQGPAAAGLAARLLTEVAAFTGRRR